MKCKICVGRKPPGASGDCFMDLLDQIKIHYNAFQMKISANVSKIQVLEDLNADYKRELDILTKENDSLKLQIQNGRTPKKRKKTTSMDIEDDEDALTDNDLNVGVHSQNLFDDSSMQDSSSTNIFDRKKSSKSPLVENSPVKVLSVNNSPIKRPTKTPTKDNDSWGIFNKTPKKTPPASEFKTPSKLDTSESKTSRVLALYSPKSKKILASPLKKDLPKRKPISSSGWTSKRVNLTTNLKNSMSFISNCNKENKALIQSRLVFPKNDGNSLILDSDEETFCDEIQSSQKSPGPRNNKSKRLKKSTSSVSKSLASKFFNQTKEVSETSVKDVQVPAPVVEKSPEIVVKQEPVEDDSGELEVVEEDESLRIKSVDLLAELMNQEGTENLHYMKSISDIAAKQIQKRNEAKGRSLALKNTSKPHQETKLSTSTEAKKTSTPLQNQILLKVKEEPLDESMNTTEEIWEEFEKNDLNEAEKSTNKKDLKSDNVEKPGPSKYPKIPDILYKEVNFKQRTYKDCIDCMTFINTYKDQFPQEVIDKRIANCNRHTRMEEDPNMTPEGFWDPFMDSLPPDDRRKEVFLDYRLLEAKEKEKN